MVKITLNGERQSFSPKISNNARMSTLVSSTKCFTGGMASVRKGGSKGGREGRKTYK